MVERSFYFNPYSGELSLEFPKTERNCKGGILAYVTLFVAIGQHNLPFTPETVRLYSECHHNHLSHQVLNIRHTIEESRSWIFKFLDGKGLIIHSGDGEDNHSREPYSYQLWSWHRDSRC